MLANLPLSAKISIFALEIIQKLTDKMNYISVSEFAVLHGISPRTMFKNGLKRKFNLSAIFINILIFLIGIIYFYISYHTSFQSDDLYHYLLPWKGMSNMEILENYPNWFFSHWCNMNGRLADKLTPFLFAISSKPILDVLNGASILLLMYVFLKCSGLQKNCLIIQFILIFLFVFTLPWWDGLSIMVGYLNYVWSTAFVLAFYLLLKTKIQTNKFSLLSVLFINLLGFVTGAMHESAGFPLMCGLILYAVHSHKFKFVKKHWFLVIGFVFGCLFSVSSPASWNRALGSAQIQNILFSPIVSNFYLIITLILILCLLCNSRYRGKVSTLSNSSWLIFIIASSVAAVFSISSGQCGRSGWFSQIYALIALAKIIDVILPSIRFTIQKRFAWVTSFVVLAHLLGFGYWQTIVNKEFDDAIKLYKTTTTDYISMNYHKQKDIPWYCLSKTRGVPEADKIWQIMCIEQFYFNGNKQFVVIPPKIISKQNNQADIVLEDSFISTRAETDVEYAYNVPVMTQTFKSGIESCKYRVFRINVSGKEVYYFEKIGKLQ